MKKQRIWTLLVVTWTLLLGAACGGTGQSDSPETISLSAVSSNYDFASYHFNLDFRFATVNESGTPYDQTMRADVTVTTDPPATGMVMNVAGIPELATFGDGSDISMVQFTDATYMTVPSLGCLQAPDDGSIQQSLAALTNANNFLGMVEDAVWVGTEVVNGIEVNHYQFDLDNVKAENAENLDALQGDLYLAVEDAYLVRLEMTGAGLIADFITGLPRTGELFLTMDLSQVNEDLLVELPEACTAVDHPTASEFPMLDDATEIVNMPGMFSYQTPTAVADVATFYVETLTAEGWLQDIDSAYFDEQTAVLTFTREGAKMAVTIGVDPITGLSSVIILSE